MCVCFVLLLRVASSLRTSLLATALASHFRSPRGPGFALLLNRRHNPCVVAFSCAYASLHMRTKKQPRKGCAVDLEEVRSRDPSANESAKRVRWREEKCEARKPRVTKVRSKHTFNKQSVKTSLLIVCYNELLTDPDACAMVSESLFGRQKLGYLTVQHGSSGYTPVLPLGPDRRTMG